MGKICEHDFRTLYVNDRIELDGEFYETELPIARKCKKCGLCQIAHIDFGFYEPQENGIFYTVTYTKITQEQYRKIVKQYLDDA